MNRKIRRAFTQSKGLTVEPEPLIDMGNCWYCDKPVLAGVGQSIKHLKVRGQSHPTHKLCREDEKNMWIK